MIRLFVGLELSAPIQEQLQLMRGGIEGARWQRDGQYHVTLAYIGEVPGNTLKEIESELSRIHFRPYELRLKGVGMFGNGKQRQTLWAGIEDEAPLQHLHDKIMNALARIDVEADSRRFKPHVMLARFKRGVQPLLDDWLAVNNMFSSPVQHVEHFSLFSSVSSKEGPNYAVEAQFGPGIESSAEIGSDGRFGLVEHSVPNPDKWL